MAKLPQTDGTTNIAICHFHLSAAGKFAQNVLILVFNLFCLTTFLLARTDGNIVEVEELQAANNETVDGIWAGIVEGNCTIITHHRAL